MRGSHTPDFGGGLLRPPPPGWSELGGLAVDEFRRTYFGSCWAELNVLLDTSKERRRDCDANVLENML